MMRLSRAFRLRAGLAALLCAASLSAHANVESSSTPAAYPAASVPAAEPAQVTRTLHYTLEQLGAQYALELRGVDGINSLPLELPDDIQVVSAQLKLRFTHSPDLLEELSHINVRLDGKHVVSIPLEHGEAEQPQEYEVTLPAAALEDYSQLSLQLIGHYTLRCENPRHPSLWAKIDNQSELTLNVVPRPASNDLNRLPRPFFDPRASGTLTLPFVFAGAPDTAALEAAGVLSSWFGALADYRGARFPVLHGALPEAGNAIVIIGAANSFEGLDLPPAKGPQVSIVDHPGGQGGKLLLVRGRNPDELKQAAQAIALGGQTLSGSKAAITQLDVPAPRKAYDAPRWLPGDRPIELGALARPESMEVRGFSPGAITVGFRVPPDLYAWNNAEVPLNLRYRYTPRPKSDQSRLHVQLNHQGLASLPIPTATHATSLTGQWLAKLSPDDATFPAEAQLMLPISALSAESQLEFLFYYDYVSRGECKDVLIDTVRGRIDPQSTLDISGLKHFIALPDMAAFGNGGFPFTRMADLSETAVVLPQRSSAEEQALYLDLLGLMGASTGYPATRVQLAAPEQLETLKGKDILVISGQDTQQALGPWADRLPVGLNALQGGVKAPRPFWQRIWQSVFGTAVAQDAALPATGPAVLLSGFESPLSGGRSVVVVASAQPALLNQATEALLDPERLRRIRGSSVSVHADGVRTLDDQTRYYSGSLGMVRHTLWYFQRHPLLFALLSALTVAVLGVFMHLALRARAKKRLQS